MTLSKYKILYHALINLRQNSLLDTAVQEFENSAEEINNALYHTISREIPDYIAAGDQNSISLLKQHLKHHTQCIIEIIFSDISVNFDFVAEFIQLSAKQHYSLESNLHLYRICQKVYSRQLRDSILRREISKKKLTRSIAMFDDFIFEYMDSISTLAAQVYVEQTRIITQAAGDKRAQQLTFLLDGFDDSDNQIRSALYESG